MNLAGARFGRLTVLSEAEKRSGDRYWCARCECGQETTVRQLSLRSGATKSCGCLQRETAGRIGRETGTKHGYYGTSTYHVWATMLQRCKPGSKADSAKNYADRGIRVCERWHSFPNFLADMGERPDGLTLDRIDNNKGYEPGNCRWATWHEQRMNQRRMQR
jgi:hypothetical protein